MKINSITTLAGPNVHLHHPVLVATLETGDNLSINDVPRLIERLSESLPELASSTPSDVASLVADVTRALMRRVEIAVDDPGPSRGAALQPMTVVVAYRAERATKYLLGVAVELVGAAVTMATIDLDGALAEARRLVARYELGPSTRAIVEAAERRGIPCTRIGDDSMVQLGTGRHIRRIQAATTDATSTIAVEISCDKQLTKTLLASASLPVPRGELVRSEEEALAALTELGAPVVVKPLDGCQGKGVSLDVRTEEDLRKAYAIAREHRGGVLVEEQVEGRNYRVLVVDGVMVAASERLPAHVVGDGVSTVAALVELANQDPRRGDDHEKPLTKIVIDAIALEHMAKSGVALEDIPAEGEVVWLREGVNLSTGGIARDVTDQVHPTVRLACERAARIVGLDICGIDLVAADIARPVSAGYAAIIEVNAAPGLRMHAFPSEGSPRDVGGAIVEMLFPDAAPSRVPVVSITGTNGKTTVTRLVAHVLGSAGRTVGMTTSNGIWIGGECIAEGDTSGPHSARTVLGDPSVDIAVLETARGGIVRRGLGYDWSDVAVITNVQPDHFGQDGIETIDDLVHIKSLVAERVREGGTIILNADDPSLVALASHPRIAEIDRRIVLFSLDPASEALREHRRRGATAYLLRDGWIVEAVGESEQRIVRAEDVSMTLNATARHQISNVLAAVAACRAEGLAAGAIATALMRFRSTAHNRGRFNLFRMPSGGHVLVDYAHNPEAFRAICAAAARWSGVRVTGIVGVPGNRNDRLIVDAGRVAAKGFDRVVVVEEGNNRRRRAGEVASLLVQSIKRSSPQRECMIVLDPSTALAQELGRIGSSDVVVVFLEAYESLIEQLERCGAVAVEALPRTLPQQRAQMARADNGRTASVARSA